MRVSGKALFALGLVVIVGAGVLGDSGSALAESDPEFVHSPVLLAEVERLKKKYPDESGKQKYQRAGHQYTTYIVAMAAGLGRDRSYKLAYFSQFPDDEREFSATRGAFYFLDPNYRRQLMAVLHSLHGGGHAAVLKRREDLKALVARGIKEGGLEDFQIGLTIHALADAYAHTKGEPDALSAFGYVVGHLFHGHEPDFIAYDPDKYKAYTCALFEALSGRNICESELAGLHAVIEGLKKKRNAELAEIETYARGKPDFEQEEYDAFASVWKDSVSKGDVRATLEVMEAAISGSLAVSDDAQRRSEALPGRLASSSAIGGRR